MKFKAKLRAHNGPPLYLLLSCTWRLCELSVRIKKSFVYLYDNLVSEQSHSAVSTLSIRDLQIVCDL